MAQRPSKRQKTALPNNAFADPIPFLDEFATVHANTGRLAKVGKGFRTLPPERVHEPTEEDWAGIKAWAPPDDLDFALLPDGESYNEVLDADVMQDSPPAMGQKKKKSKVSRRPHVVWKELHRQAYLDEITRAAGRGDFLHAKDCPDCVSRRVVPPGRPEYRCEECLLPDLTCASCCVRRHRLQPLHWITKWTGSTFVKTSLKALGLKIQLNHASLFCDNPIPCHTDLLVLHTNGIHSAAIQYCGCSRAIPQHLQLLRRRLYPASQINVKTCASFELLRLLHKLALTTKASTYDFYRGLEQLTTSARIDAPKPRYKALFRIVLQWRHLQMLKWAGRAHAESGVEGTQAGELAIRCPSCPTPGINLPEGWENAPDGMKFLYMVIICMDANFRLKNQIVSNYSQDPGLGIGWAYMLPRTGYERYVLSRANDNDVSTCVGFQALAKANTKFSVSLRYTGVSVAVCGRSEMIFPNGVGNLQKGERYANMDYLCGTVLQYIFVLLVLLSYDIACQWFINLSKRIDEHWPDEIKPSPRMKFTPAIPKLHEPMHQQAGHQEYSLNNITGVGHSGVGHSDGECPERVWSGHNQLGNSTKTQGPGSRQDVLDDHFGFWNWLKYVSMGSTLARRYKAAVGERNLQTEGHRGLSESLDADLVEQWERLCREWDDDSFPKQKKNPYHTSNSSLSEAQVKKKLAEEEASYLAGGGTFLHATTDSMFIALGLELEETQRRLRRLAKSTSASLTTRKEGTLTEQRNGLLARLRAWELLLPIYIPGLLQYQSDHADLPIHATKSDKPEDAILWLPSRIPEPHRSTICAAGLGQIEERVRDAQCADALDSVRKVLTLKARMVQFKNKNIRGQRDGTRSRAVIDRVHERARAAVEKYRDARAAKFAIAGPGDWEELFQVLEDGDIRSYQDPNRLRARVARRGTLEDDQADAVQTELPNEGEEFVLFSQQRSRRDGTGETRRTLSWIWLMPGSNSTEGRDEILQVEWAKSRARALRATEEVMLLKEEMRRVLAFLEWKAKWWRERAEARSGVAKDLGEGIRASALAQGELQDALAAHFRQLWKAPLSEQDVAEEPNADEDEGDPDDGDDEDGSDEAEGADELYDPDGEANPTAEVP